MQFIWRATTPDAAHEMGRLCVTALRRRSMQFGEQVPGPFRCRTWSRRPPSNMKRPMKRSQHRTQHSPMIHTGRQGPVSAGLNLKKRVKIGLVCRKNSQSLEIATLWLWVIWVPKNAMSPCHPAGRQLPENNGSARSHAASAPATPPRLNSGVSYL